MVHNQVHFLGLRGRYGDLISDLLVAYLLLGVTVENYAKVHLSHYKLYFTEKDLDYLRKAGVDRTFPMSSTRLARLLLSDMLGFSFTKLLKGKRLEKNEFFQTGRILPQMVTAHLLFGNGSAIDLYGNRHIFLLYWVLPLLTVFPLIVRLGAICEHVYNLPGASAVESSPLILQRSKMAGKAFIA